MIRREFLTLAGGAAVASAQTSKTVRVGVVGTGNRGTALLGVLLDLPGVEVAALCDVDGAALGKARELVARKHHAPAEEYSRGEDDYRRLIERSDLNAVIIATPWELHTKIAVAAMQAGKYAGVEVPAALTVEECWDLVKTSEKTGVPCMLLENVNYFRNVMLVLNMIRQGVFGEVIHCAGGYQHDVRYIKFDAAGELRWRGRQATERNGNLYPTHPIGPIARWMNINHGDRFAYLTSMSTVSRGMNEYAARKFGPRHPQAVRHYTEGDVNSTLIKTANGYTVTLEYETQTARVYDLGFRVQGTKGLYSGTLDKIFLEGERADGREEWRDLAPYYEKYEHPMWKEAQSTASHYGHGGGDYLVLREFIKAVRERTQTPIDVYDAATWSAIVGLTGESIARGSAPVEFPDFTDGRWKKG
jgi:predicted dehydrogenase